MAPRTLRKALGAMKDQTSIALANVASTRAPELDIALVKATSHEEAPVDEKYVQEILQMTACSRGYVNVCVAGLARRLGKTRNWIVALKTLMLTHRLMREGDPQFETELKHAGRRGMRMLNLSHFRDDSNSSAWDYSAFVRTYALFIDEKLDSSSVSGDARLTSGHIRSPVEIGRKSSFGMDDSSFKGRHRSPDRQSGRRHSFDGGQSNRSCSFDADKFELDGRLGKKERIQMKDMSITKVLEKLPALQRLMDRILGCRPTGAAKTNRLVQIALYPLVKESYHLYSEICDGMTVILDGFFELEQANRVRAFEIYNQSAKQGDELAAFYNLCKNYGVGRSHEYPQVQKVSQEHLDTLEEFLRERSHNTPSRNQKPKEPEAEQLQIEYRPPSPKREPEVMEEAVEDTIEVDPPQEVLEPKAEIVQKQPDLLDLEPAISPETHENSLALALFSDGAGTTKWEPFGPAAQDSSTQGSNNTNWQNSLDGKADWELALVESTSHMSKPVHTGSLAGGLDPLLLTSMYDQGLVNQQSALVTAPQGSASSVAVLVPNPGAATLLALPAPPGALKPEPVGGYDPFAASAVVPPPAYVQIADMGKKQQFLAHEQVLWQQYQMDGMRGEQSFMKNPYVVGMPAALPQQNLAVPYYNMSVPVQNPYASY